MSLPFYWVSAYDLQMVSLQKAAVRACRNAIEFNSLPAIRKLVCSPCTHPHDPAARGRRPPAEWRMMHLCACCASCNGAVLWLCRCRTGTMA